MRTILLIFVEALVLALSVIGYMRTQDMILVYTVILLVMTLAFTLVAIISSEPGPPGGGW